MSGMLVALQRPQLISNFRNKVPHPAMSGVALLEALEHLGWQWQHPSHFPRIMADGTPEIQVGTRFEGLLIPDTQPSFVMHTRSAPLSVIKSVNINALSMST